jgi:Tfp pilus assembly protein PilZ
VPLPNEARPRRLIPRFPLAQQVQLRGSGIAPRSYAARDVSQGGFFLATDDVFELFTDVQLDVTLPNGEQTTLPARVVHILPRDKAQSVGVPAGIGVQFEGLNETQLAQVRELVAWARANDPRPRIARKNPNGDLAALKEQPMLSYLFEHIDGQRDPEALAEELGIEVGSVERMQRELIKLGVITVVAANGQTPTSQTPIVLAPQPTATAARSEAKPASLAPKQAATLAELEQRIARGNLYVALDVPESANADTIRARFQTLSEALRSWSGKPADMARIERVQNQLREAFGVLSSPQKRGEYDQYLERGRSLPQTEAMRAAQRMSAEFQPVAGKAPAAPAKPAAAAPRASTVGTRPVERAPAQPAAAAPRAIAAQRPRGPGAAAGEQQAPLGAAAQILAQAEQAHAAGKLAEVKKHLTLLTAMTFDDAKIRARVAHLKMLVARTLAVDFEKQAAYEEKQQSWALAARSWLRVAEGRPKDSLPLQRAALAQLQAGADLKQVLEIAKRAVELADGDPEAHRTLARVYDAAGMQANARRELEAAQRCGGAPVPEDAAKGAADKGKAERGLFKRLLGRDAPN